MSTQPQYTTPAVVSQASVEDLTWGIDTAPNMTGDSTPTDVTVTLTNGNLTVTLEDEPVVTGTVITQRIRAGVLRQQPRNYLLAAVYTASGSTNTFTSILAINCPSLGT